MVEKSMKKEYLPYLLIFMAHPFVNETSVIPACRSRMLSGFGRILDKTE
jgi:hypothetical protein